MSADSSQEKGNKKEKAPESKAKMDAAAPRKPKTRRLPVIMELPFTLAQLLVTLTGAVVAVLSFLAGCSPLMIAIRTGAAMLVTGLIGWFIYYNIARGSLETIHSLLEEQQELERSANQGRNRNYLA